MALKITDKNFAEVIENAGNKPVMIDFWAEWCGPCKMISPVIEAIAEERTDAIVGKVDVDKNPNLSFEFQVRSIPTIIVLKKGKVVARQVGGNSRDFFEKMLDAEKLT
jgi:thioredoxin 1